MLRFQYVLIPPYLANTFNYTLPTLTKGLGGSLKAGFKLKKMSVFILL
ncbi:hypothetical protein NEOC95_000241 [Neochlamydia sp. AcF95]|nr:hypothetical protein [Neochlamydia sp. AcF95]